MNLPHKPLWILIALLLATPPASRGRGFEDAINSALPRAVKLYGLGAGVQKGYGSGMLVSADGQVLTVYSLLIDAHVIRAITADGAKYKAKVVHRDKGRQLALLQLVRPQTASRDAAAAVGPFPFFDLAVETDLSPGDWVVAAGNSFKVAEGAEPVSLAHGVFSVRTQLDARRRVKEFIYRGDVLVIDGITSNPGAPGSALVNLDGALVGMVGRVVTSNYTHTHLNYAMPRDVLYTSWLDATSTDRGQKEPAKRMAEPVDLGIRMARAGYKTRLPFVDRVKRNSPARRAGLRPDDLILSVNGHTVSDTDAFDKRLSQVVSGEPIDLVIRRGRQVLQIRVERGPPK